MTVPEYTPTVKKLVSTVGGCCRTDHFSSSGVATFMGRGDAGLLCPTSFDTAARRGFHSRSRDTRSLMHSPLVDGHYPHSSHYHDSRFHWLGFRRSRFVMRSQPRPSSRCSPEISGRCIAGDVEVADLLLQLVVLLEGAVARDIEPEYRSNRRGVGRVSILHAVGLIFFSPGSAGVDILGIFQGRFSLTQSAIVPENF
jgi:hypothetical protein